MDHSKTRRNVARKRRALRVRKKLHGSSEKPRLSVSKTNKHIYAQLIDDDKGVSIAGVGTLSEKNREGSVNKKSKQAAREIGRQIGELAKQKSIQAVIFDRGINKYHGLIAELADGAREAGLQF